METMIWLPLKSKGSNNNNVNGAKLCNLKMSIISLYGSAKFLLNKVERGNGYPIVNIGKKENCRIGLIALKYFDRS